MLKGYRTYICVGTGFLIQVLTFILQHTSPDNQVLTQILQGLVMVLTALAGYFRYKA